MDGGAGRHSGEPGEPWEDRGQSPAILLPLLPSPILPTCLSCLPLAPVRKRTSTSTSTRTHNLQGRRDEARRCAGRADRVAAGHPACRHRADGLCRDRKSTRLNSSHLVISYAVFCLKKKNN